MHMLRKYNVEITMFLEAIVINYRITDFNKNVAHIRYYLRGKVATEPNKRNRANNSENVCLFAVNPGFVELPAN